MGRLPAVTYACFVGLVAGLSPSEAIAQDMPFATGRVIEDVVADDDSTQTFTLYIPTAYSPDRTWPLVVLMDPRGNSVYPLRQLLAAGEELGYVLASSNNTASDVDHDPNTPAVNAILGTLMPQLSIDDRRIYLFGMSGTARTAWALGFAGIPHIAGVAGFGAGIPPDMNLETLQGQFGAPFVFYGGAGDQDFNHAEMVLLEGRLRRLGFRFTTSYYSDRHGWPTSDSEFAAALAWLHLMAMQRELIPVDTAWVAREYEWRFGEARAAEAEGILPRAWQDYARLAADFADLVDTSIPAERARTLAANADVKAWRSERLELARAQRSYSRSAGEWLQYAQTADPTLEEALEALAVDSLVSVASNDSEPDAAAAAVRALADLFSLTSFYFTRYHMQRQDWPRARLTLQVADVIFPGTQRVCSQLARIASELGEEVESGC